MSTARWVVGLCALTSAGGLVALACQGGSSSSDTNNCAENYVFVEDIKKANPLPQGEPECASNTDCVVRVGGNFCGCPYAYEAISMKLAVTFDEKAKSVACTCPAPGCDAGIFLVAAGCHDGRCSFGRCDGTGDPFGFCASSPYGPRDSGHDAPND